MFIVNYFVPLHEIRCITSKRDMAKKRKKARSRRGLQVVTLCISTTMVLMLLGMVVFFVLSARNLSAHMKENLTVTVMLKD